MERDRARGGKRIAIDIDGTIFVEREDRSQDNAVPINGAIESINSLYDDGYTIILHTARTYRELETTIAQLKSNGVKYHHLVLGKPVADVFVDDRAIIATSWASTVEAIKEKIPVPSAKKIVVMVSSAGSTNGVNVIKALQEQKDYSITVVAVDSNPNASGLYLADQCAVVPQVDSSSYLQSTLSVCRQHGVDMIIPSHSTEIPFYSANSATLDKIGIKTMAPRRGSLDICSDKLQLTMYFERNGVNCPKTYWLPGDASFPAFVKSRFGSGSTYARRVDSRADLEYYYGATPHPIIQEYVEGTEYTVSILSDYDGRVIGAVPVRRVRVRWGLSVEAQVELDAAIADGSKAIVEKLKLIGPSNVQVIRRGEELAYVEVNPRLASGTLPLVVGAGFNVPLLMVKLALGEPIGNINVLDGLKMTRYLDCIIRSNG